jgi:hypothetical protein
MSEQLSIPGIPAVDPRKEAWREHTAERWQRKDPEAYAECIEAVRNGELNKSALRERFGVSRNTVQALMMKEFTVEQLQAINGKVAAMTVGEALSKADELVDDTEAKEIGALAMLAKQASDIAQVTSGGPTEIREERHVLSVEEFLVLAQGTGLEAGEMGVMAAVEVPLGPQLPYGAAGAVGEIARGEALRVRELEAKEAVLVSKREGSVGGDQADFDGGGGGLARGAAPESLTGSVT